MDGMQDLCRRCACWTGRQSCGIWHLAFSIWHLCSTGSLEDGPYAMDGLLHKNQPVSIIMDWYSTVLHNM